MSHMSTYQDYKYKNVYVFLNLIYLLIIYASPGLFFDDGVFFLFCRAQYTEENYTKKSSSGLHYVKSWLI